MIITQVAWTLATATLVGFGAAIGWRKGNQAGVALDRASRTVSASIKQAVDRAIGRLPGPSVTGDAEATTSAS